MARAPLAALILLVTFPPPAAAPHRAGELRLEPYSFRTFDGAAHPAELGHLWVPENRRAPAGRLIELGFVLLKSAAPRPLPPVVFLPGGPGIPATAMGRVPVYFDLFRRLQAQSDVILLDQRGLGLSSPNTQCPAGPPPPADVFLTESGFRRALIARARACAAAWRARGLDLASFSTAESADDLDDLRRALGAEKLSLLAHSYGTSVALEAVRRDGANLGRVVLAGVEGPGQALQMPLTFDFALRRLSLLAASSSNAEGEFPDTDAEFRQVLERAGREPVPVVIQDQRARKKVNLKLGAFFLAFAVKDMLPNGRKAGLIPALVDSLARGDTSLIAPAAQDLYNALASGFTAMEFAVLCSDGWPAGRRALAREQASRSVFGDAPFFHLDPRLCREIGVPGPEPDSFLPVWSPVRALAVIGTLDSNTPPGQAGQVLWGLPNAGTLLVENGFHETLPSPDVQAAVVRFFAGSDVPLEIIKNPAPQFLTVEQARKSPQPPH